jgi:hypothetical protein
MHRILAIVLLTLHGGLTRSVAGSYLAQTMNGQPVPADLRVPVTGGDYRLFRLEQGLLRLGDDRHFTLYFRYYHQLVRRGDKPVSTPVMAESETGTYTIRSGSIVLVPRKKSGRKSPSSITATLTDDQIRASYSLESAGTPQRVTLVLRRDARYW